MKFVKEFLDIVNVELPFSNKTHEEILSVLKFNVEGSCYHGYFVHEITEMRLSAPPEERIDTPTAECTVSVWFKALVETYRPGDLYVGAVVYHKPQKGNIICKTGNAVISVSVPLSIAGLLKKDDHIPVQIQDIVFPPYDDKIVIVAKGLIHDEVPTIFNVGDDELSEEEIYEIEQLIERLNSLETKEFDKYADIVAPLRDSPKLPKGSSLKSFKDIKAIIGKSVKVIPHYSDRNVEVYEATDDTDTAELDAESYAFVVGMLQRCITFRENIMDLEQYHSAMPPSRQKMIERIMDDGKHKS